MKYFNSKRKKKRKTPTQPKPIPKKEILSYEEKEAARHFFQTNDGGGSNHEYIKDIVSPLYLKILSKVSLR